MKKSIKENIYAPWGRVLELNDGVAELKVTLDMGPRIIYYALNNGPNLMYEDVEDNITKDGPFFKENFSGKKWRIIGGHRLWKTPEDMESYYPDLSKVNYKVEGNEVAFSSEREKTTGILKTLSIKMRGEGRFSLSHKFTNTNKETINVGLWALTVLAGEGKIYFFTNEKEEGFLPTQNLVFWPYTDYKDSRFEIFDDYMTVAQNREINKPFKIGAYLEKGLAAYSCKNNLFIKRFTVCENLYSYPDKGCNFEVYTNNYIIECESLSKIFAISPDQSAVHTEDWELIKCTNTDALQYLKNLIRSELQQKHSK